MQKREWFFVKLQGETALHEALTRFPYFKTAHQNNIQIVSLLENTNT